MNRRWLLFDFIDPAFGVSRSERHKIFASALTSKGAATRLWLGIMAGLLLGMLVGSLPIIAMPWLNLKPGSNLSLLFLVVLYPFAMYFAVLFGFYRAFAKPLRLAMQRHGYEFCHQCRQPLIGLGKDIEQCPECGISREPLTCQICGYDLTGLGGDPPSCPECGDDQKTPPDQSRVWWVRLRQIDPCFLYFPDSVRRRMFSTAWKLSSGRFLIAMLLIIAAMMTLALIFIPLSLEVNGLSAGRWGFLFNLFLLALFSLWCLFASSIHKTFGMSYRRQFHDLGYDLCLKCGRLQHDPDNGLQTCPDCNAPRQSMPDVEPLGGDLPTLEELKAIGDSHDAIFWGMASNLKWVFIKTLLIMAGIFGIGALVFLFANNALGWSVYTLAWLLLAFAKVNKHRMTLRRLVLDDLHAKGHDLCPACGFWFTKLGKAPDRCLDCGTLREPLTESNPEEHAIRK